MLCLSYGEKVPIKRVTNIVGAGNASNVAIGAARLGWNSVVQSIIGNDRNGEAILANWKKEGVRTTFVQVDKNRPTNYHTVLHYQDERTILIYHEPRQYHLPTLPESRWVYYTSLGQGHERLEGQLFSYLRSHSEAKLVFQPGTFQLRRPRSAIAPVIAASHIFAVNKQEAQRILENTTDAISELMRGLHKLGTKIAVITDGHNGSYASDGRKIWFCPIFPGEVIERTGAGDSYTLGFIYGYNQSGSIPEAMRAGTANSWSVIKYIGAHTGLLSARRLRLTLQKFAHLQAVEYTDTAPRSTSKRTSVSPKKKPATRSKK